MNSYTFIGSEQDLIDNDFTYRPHYDDYAWGYHEEDYETKQDLFIQVNHKTNEVFIYIQCLTGHRNELYSQQAIYISQADIYPIYFKVINELIEKNIIKEKEND